MNSKLPSVLTGLIVIAAGVGAGAGCGSDDRRSPADAAVAIAPPVGDEPAVVVPAPPPFPEDTRSLRLIRSVAVRLGPGDDAKRIGTIAQDTRVAWTQVATARGCKQPWVEIAPRGWVCGEYLEPLTKAPSGVELPRLAAGEIVPGVYGKVADEGATTFTFAKPPKPAKPAKAAGKPAKAARPVAKVRPTDGPVTSPGQVDDTAAPTTASAKPRLIAGRPLLGSVNVRRYGELTIDGRVYWKIAQKEDEYVLRSAIRQHTPSEGHGARLGDDTGLALPIAFVWPRRGYSKAWTHGKPRGGGAKRQLAAQVVLPVLEASEEKGKVIAYRVGDGEWMDAADLRVVQPAPPPAGLRPHERWLDVDLDTQVLVAYEGDLPVYVTLVAAGKEQTPTETGIYRIWKKVSETDMRGLSGEDPYSVATVPWTQFFSPEKGLALHTAYWHDRFGAPRSHGCVNLTPIDARWLYFWSEPLVPPGWTMTAGVVEAPGSIVRVRSSADPEPPLRGYAIKVAEERTRTTQPTFTVP